MVREKSLKENRGPDGRWTLSVEYGVYSENLFNFDPLQLVTVYLQQIQITASTQ